MVWRDHVVMQLRDWSCIRMGDSKLTIDPDGTEVRELYRLSTDPFEETNLVADQGEKETVDELQATYREWLRSVRSRI